MAGPVDPMVDEDEDITDPVLTPIEVSSDLVPTADQDVPLATYCDWDRSTTRVITYVVNGTPPNGLAGKLVHWGMSRDSARRDCEARYGRVFEANYVPGRAFFRVKKAAS